MTLDEKNEDIEQQFIEQGIKGDISALLDDIRNYQESIDFHQDKLLQIEAKEQDLYAFQNLRKGYSSIIKGYLEDEVDSINSSWEKLNQGQDNWNEEQDRILKDLLENIDVHGSINFDEEIFYDSVFSCLDGKKFRKTESQNAFSKLKEFFNVQDPQTFFRLINNEEIIDLDGEFITLEKLLNIEDYFNSGGQEKLPKVLFEANYRNKYLKSISEIEFDNKPPRKLSVGQRGTLYVSIKLATDPFSTPFVFDQPEDDLDNKFIMDRLVPIFKKIKKYRQVIIVTHNANLVLCQDNYAT